MDARIILRDEYLKEQGRVPDEDLAMYADWLELKVTRLEPVAIKKIFHLCDECATENEITLIGRECEFLAKAFTCSNCKHHQFVWLKIITVK